MYRLLFLLISIPFVIMALPLKNDSLNLLNNFGAIILDEGIAELKTNEFGASIVLETGKLWVNGTDERIQILLRDGIISVSGTALVETDDVATRVRVVYGFVRYVEMGGTPAVIIPAGYDQKIFANGTKVPRMFTDSTILGQLCDSFPGTVQFGCTALADTTKPFVPAGEDTILTNCAVVIHSVSGDQKSLATDIVGLPEQIKQEINKLQPTASVTVEKNVDYRKEWEYAHDSSLQYVIIDLVIRKALPNQKSPMLQILFYDSQTKQLTSYEMSITSETSESMGAKIVRELIAYLLKK